LSSRLITGLKEFSHFKETKIQLHPFDRECERLGIVHKTIQTEDSEAQRESGKEFIEPTTSVFIQPSGSTVLKICKNKAEDTFTDPTESE
jgi:hypothetical protein